MPLDTTTVAISITARRELLRQAANLIERAERHERWGCAAMEYAAQAVPLLRAAGLPALADRLAETWGADAAAILKEIDREARR